MDPEVAFQNYLTAQSEAFEALESLGNWLSKGGFSPTVLYTIDTDHDDDFIGECEIAEVSSLETFSDASTQIRIRTENESVWLKPQFDCDGLSFYDESGDRVFRLSFDKDDFE